MVLYLPCRENNIVRKYGDQNGAYRVVSLFVENFNRRNCAIKFINMHEIHICVKIFLRVNSYSPIARINLKSPMAIQNSVKLCTRFLFFSRTLIFIKRMKDARTFPIAFTISFMYQPIVASMY